MCACETAPTRCVSDLGHLLRELRLLESLYFQRAGGERFYMTLVNARLGRLGLALDVPRIGKLIVALNSDGRHLRYHICREPNRELSSIETAPFEPVLVWGAGGSCLRITAQRAARDQLALRFEIPAVGTATITFHLHRDRVRAAITAEKAIRVLPTRHSREAFHVGRVSVPA